MSESVKEKEKKEEVKKPKSQTNIEFTSINGKQSVMIISVSKDGVVKKYHETGEKAISTLKKFVSSL